MANPLLLPGFDTNDTNTTEPIAALQTDGYSFNQIVASANFNYLVKQLYDATNKSANDGVWDWQDPATSDREYNTDSLVRHGGLFWQSTADANTGEPGVGANWEISINQFEGQTVTHNFTVDADYTLTAAQNLYGRIILTDTGVVLTTGRSVITDNIEKSFTVQNDTLQDITVKTLAGTGILVPAGTYANLYNDGTNIISLDLQNTPSIGVNQTWQDVTGSRLNNVIYTNNTGDPIFVSVVVTATTTSASYTVGGLTSSVNKAETTMKVNFTFVVPDGVAYKVVSATGIIDTWYEVRGV